MTPGHAAETDSERNEPPTTEQLAQLEAALLSLPRFTREVFLAHRIDDLSYVEIADTTGVSVQRIEREMARAIGALHCAMTVASSPRRRRRRWRWFGGHIVF
jgi:RNA polymerase sigma-70 factor (ECF subfamily)